MKKILVRLIDRDDRPVGFLEVNEISRKPDENYERRTAVRMGVKYIEPEADALEFSTPNDWREVTQ